MTSCPFCQTPVEQSLNQLKALVHACPCGVKFSVKNDVIESWSFDTTFNQKIFKLIFIRDLLGKPEFSVSENKREIFRLRILPNITPTNASEKLKLYLLFS